MVRLSRRVLAVVAAVLALVASFGGGVAVGVLGSRADGARGVTAATGASVLDEAAERIESRAVRPVDRSRLQKAAVDGMLAALGDRWSSYYSSSAYASFRDSLDGRYTGVGLWLRDGGSGRLVVGSVQHGSPAAVAGVVTGDEVVALDGRPVAGRSVADVAAQLRGAAGIGGLAATAGTVRLTVTGPAGRRTVTLDRETFAVRDVTTIRLAGAVTMVRISQFSRGVGRQLREALAAEPAASRSGVVLDLRGNPGGLLDEAVEVASVFLSGGPVVTVERRAAAPTTLDALGTGDTTTPVVVLVDHGTASAAEVLAAALQDRNRAIVVGSRTFGKGSVQEPTTLSDGSALELTVGSYRTPDGRSLDGVGITPDITVDPAASRSVGERRAVEVLSGLLASLDSGGRG